MMTRKSRARAAAMMAAAIGAAAYAGSASGQVQTAGNLLVNLRANNPTAGTAAWVNTGVLGGAFTAVGTPSLSNVGGVDYVVFDPNEAYRGPTAPADITGSGDRSIEVWVRNPSIATEDTIVAWGHRGGPEGTNLAFNHGSNTAFGAVGHWGGPDMGWNGAPTAAELHHLVYTYDGGTVRVYADGVEKNSRALTLNTHGLATDTINLIAQNNAAGTLEFISSDGMDISVVRVHGGALSAAQVASNFAAGPGADVPEPGAAAALAAVALVGLRRRRRSQSGP